MAVTRVTPNACARTVMETVPMVMRFIRGEMRRQRAPLLSVPQFRALAFLHRSPGACLFAVADHLGVSRPTASTIIDRLVRRGLVARGVDPRERRRIILTLTDTGARHLQRARKATRSSMADVLGPFPRATLHRIAEGVSLLGEAFKEASRPNGR
jgi:DNA-binding MarR family transcriptional regulator